MIDTVADIRTKIVSLHTQLGREIAIAPMPRHIQGFYVTSARKFKLNNDHSRPDNKKKWPTSANTMYVLRNYELISQVSQKFAHHSQQHPTSAGTTTPNNAGSYREVYTFGTYSRPPLNLFLYGCNLAMTAMNTFFSQILWIFFVPEIFIMGDLPTQQTPLSILHLKLTFSRAVVIILHWFLFRPWFLFASISACHYLQHQYEEPNQDTTHYALTEFI